MLTSASALWSLAVVIALTLSVVLACGTQPTGAGGYSMTPEAPGYGGSPEPAPSPYGSGAGGVSGVPAKPSRPPAYGPYAPTQAGEEGGACSHG